MSKIKSFFRTKLCFFAILTIVIVVLIANGQVMGMYFWQDDSALIFKLQNPEGPAGSYGEGIIGQGAYKYLVTPFVPFFPYFGLNPFGYFSIGVLAYALATATFYLFSSELLKSRKAGFISTLIFAAGYVGSDTMFRFSNSWQTNFGLILALISFWLFTVFLRRSRLPYYFLGLVFYVLATEFVFIRSHSLIGPIFALDLLLTMVPVKLSKLPIFVLRQFPFWFVFYSWYLDKNTMGSNGVKSLIASLLDGKIERLTGFFATMGNSLVPNVIQTKLIITNEPLVLVFILGIFLLLAWILLSLFSVTLKFKLLSTIFILLSFGLNQFFIAEGLYWYKSVPSHVSGAIGLYASVIIFSLIVAWWKNKRHSSITLLIGYVILTSQIFGYYIQYPTAIFTTTHRYLSHAFVGYCIIYGTMVLVFYEQIGKVVAGNHARNFLHSKQYLNVFPWLPLLIVVASNLFLGVIYQKNLVENRSDPTREFYRNLKKHTPFVNKGAAFYFDVSQDSFSERQFNDFFSVGSMPNSTALAIYYNLDRYDLKFITDFDELAFGLSSGQIDLTSLHSFYYYGKRGSLGTLIDTSADMKALLHEGSKEEVLSSESEVSPLEFRNINIRPVTPMILTLKARVVPLVRTDQKGDLSSDLKTDSSYREIITYLQSKANYYKTNVATSSSEWKYQEIENISDNDLLTSWRGHRIYWHDNRREQLAIDLKESKTISRLRWVNWNNTLTPTSYLIQISMNNRDWQTVKVVKNGPERKSGEIIDEYFSPAVGRYVKIDILGTISNDAPAISEVEVIDAAFDKTNLDQAVEFLDSGLSTINDEKELRRVLRDLLPFLKLRAQMSTDKTLFQSETSVGKIEEIRDYEFIFNPGGTLIEKIDIDFGDTPIKLEVISAKLKNLSFSEMQERNLVKRLSRN